MTSRALLVAFKSAVLGAIDRHHLSPVEVVRHSLTLASVYANNAGYTAAELHQLLDQAVTETAKLRAGTPTDGGAQ